MVKLIVKGHLKTFDPDKHPRAFHGRFRSVPKTPETTARKAKKQLVFKNTLKSSEYEGKRILLAPKKLSIPVRTTLAHVPQAPVKPKKKKSLTRVATPETTTHTEGTRKPLTKNTSKAILKKYAKEGDLSLLTPSELLILSAIRSPTLRKPGKLSHIEIPDEGKITLWKDKPNYSKFDPEFKVRTNKKHEYSVIDNEGNKVVLNRHHNVMYYKGETIEGVPSLHPKLREMSKESLFKALIDTQGYVESSETPPAPKWKHSLHGSVDKKYLAEAGYGAMEIHHIEQWAKIRFDQITGDLDKGSITLEEAKSQMRSVLRPNPKEKSGYEIAIEPKEARKFVILAAGTHNFTSPLYLANHPVGIHPDTGKRMAFGIPKTGEGGRGEFNDFRDGFWREMYRRESYVLLGEINRRITKGLISKAEAKESLKTAFEQGDKAYKGLVEYKKGIASRNAEIRAAKEKAKAILAGQSNDGT